MVGVQQSKMMKKKMKKNRKAKKELRISKDSQSPDSENCINDAFLTTNSSVMSIRRLRCCQQLAGKLGSLWCGQLELGPSFVHPLLAVILLIAVVVLLLLLVRVVLPGHIEHRDSDFSPGHLEPVRTPAAVAPDQPPLAVVQ